MVWVSGLMEAKLTGNQVMERIGGMAPSGFSASAHPNTGSVMLQVYYFYLQVPVPGVHYSTVFTGKTIRILPYGT
jgi:hypothetical protein